ncbi:MAG: stage II sporulation protein P [Mobilitalea sp.]
MRKFRIRIRLKIYPVLWSIILLASAYILIRFAVISFSEDMGQASFSKAIMSSLYARVVEEGSSLISYYAEEERSEYPFWVNYLDHGFALGKYTEEDTVAVGADFNYVPPELTEEESQAASSQLGGLNVYRLPENSLDFEYIMTNGGILRSATQNILLGDKTLISNQLEVGFLAGDLTPYEIVEDKDNAVETSTIGDQVDYTLEQLKDTNFLKTNFYIVDKSTQMTESLFNAEEFLNKDMTMEQDSDTPQILIYHTHSKERYIDSRPNKEEDTVVGVGTYLTQILEEDYGYNVIHDTSPYDIVNGKEDRNVAYNQAEDGVSKILEKNKDIEVIIDLHRDSGNASTVMVNGLETAKIMLFNGLCRDQSGPITYLDNPYLQDNLAFSFQLQLKSKELYPGLFKKNYLKSYRFNMHLRPKSLLVELGTVNDTLQSAKNAMIPFAEVLDSILKGE